MPLRNREEQEANKLHGVNLATDPTKLEFGWFTSLRNWIPSQRLKLKKKRGVAAVPTGEFFTVSPCTPPPPVCADNSPRGQFVLAEELVFTNAAVGGNSRTSWSFITADEELYTLTGNAGCAGGNMAYSDLCCVINHFVGPGTPVDNPPLIAPDVGTPAVNCLMGLSDEPCYSFSNSTFRKAYFPLTDTVVDFESPTYPNPFGNFFGFAKRDNRFYGFDGTLGGGDSTPHKLWAWDLPGGTFAYESLALINYRTQAGGCTDNFIYSLANRAIGSSPPAAGLFKLDPTDGSLVDTFNLDGLSAYVMFPVDDTLQYLLTTNGAVYYIENFTDLVFVGRITPNSLSPFVSNGYFTNNALYYGAMGFGTGFTDVYKVSIPCPEDDPLVASVTTDASVAAGDDLQVNWFDVLQPSLSDTLRLVPDDGTAFPSALASVAPGFGTSDGTFAFPIPALTTPGSYRIQFVLGSTFLIASSVAFTVT